MKLSFLAAIFSIFFSLSLGDDHLIFNDGKYVAYWSLNETKITFQILVEAQGWIGIGFSKSESMIESDIIAAEVVNGTDEKIMELKDYHAAKAYVTPIVDKMQNIVMIDQWRNETHEYIEFSRELKTNDTTTEDIEIILGTDIYVIWAYSETEESLEYHGETLRGVSLVNFKGDDENNSTTEGAENTMSTTEAAGNTIKLENVLVVSIVAYLLNSLV